MERRVCDAEIGGEKCGARSEPAAPMPGNGRHPRADPRTRHHARELGTSRRNGRASAPAAARRRLARSCDAPV
eukprot:3104101-Pyramimonas_sp.AAC.1